MLAQDRWRHIPISVSTDVADDTRTMMQLSKIGAKRSHFSASAFSLTLPSGLILLIKTLLKKKTSRSEDTTCSGSGGDT